MTASKLSIRCHRQEYRRLRHPSSPFEPTTEGPSRSPPPSLIAHRDAAPTAAEQETLFKAIATSYDDGFVVWERGGEKNGVMIIWSAFFLLGLGLGLLLLPPRFWLTRASGFINSSSPDSDDSTRLRLPIMAVLTVTGPCPSRGGSGKINARSCAGSCLRGNRSISILSHHCHEWVTAETAVVRADGKAWAGG
ncbi:hypothetical protein V8E54_003133 [Elaphomyces granulatus]